MRRVFLLSLFLLVLLLAAGAGIAWYLLQDEDFLKAQLRTFVLKRTGRELSLDGPLQLDLGRLTTIDARGIRFQDADWAPAADMVSLGHLRLTVDLFSLFGEVPVVPLLLLEDCDVRLLQNEAGEANWDVLPEPPGETGAAPHSRTGPPVAPLDMQIRNCRLSHDAPERLQPLTVGVDTLALQLLDGARWQAAGAGRVDADALAFSGHVEPAGAALRGEPIRFDVQLEVGGVALVSSGSIQDPLTGRGADADFTFRGPDMAVVLERLGLPRFSDGAFDFHLDLVSDGQLTTLALDGDLGSLEIDASGAMDRLVRPQSGTLRVTASGPDLEALGAALGVADLVPESYGLRADLVFDNGRTRADTLVLETPADRLEVWGTLGPAPAFGASDLAVRATTEDIGRWQALARLPAATDGPATLNGTLGSDADGVFSAQAELGYADSALSIGGVLGTVKGAFEPDLVFTLESPNAAALASRFGIGRLPPAPASATGHATYAEAMLQLRDVRAKLGDHQAAVDGVVNPRRPFVGSELDVRVDSQNLAGLGSLFGRDTLPAAPASAQGRVSRPDQRVRFEDLELNLAGHQARVNGYLNPDAALAGSEVDIELDSPDIAGLAMLFGAAGLPHEPFGLSISLRQEERGLSFQTSDASVGDITLQMEGHVADLADPYGVDARFDVSLPTLKLLSFLAPDADWPDLPLSARGQLHNEADRTRLEDVQFTLGPMTADVSGELLRKQRFALDIDLRGENLDGVQPWLRGPLAGQPFELRARANGTPRNFTLEGIDARLGRNSASGDLQITLAERKRFSGRLQSPFLDLSPWRTAAGGNAAAAPQAAGPYLFDDTPVMHYNDHGIDLDLDLEVAKLEYGAADFADIGIGLLLNGERLELNPLSFSGERSGRLSGRGMLERSGPQPTLSLRLDGENLRIGMAAVPDQDPATIPPTELHLSLDGRGVTRREMASSLDGRLRFYSGSGDIAAAGVNLLLNDVLVELFNVLNPFSVKSAYTRLDCSAVAADIADGQVAVYPVVFHTRELTILSQGTVDLRSEKLDLTFNSKPRQGLGISAGVLINPLIKLGGTLAEPAVELDPARAMVSGGTAVATAGLSLLAKGFSDRYLSSKDPCGDARKEIEERDRGEVR